MHRVCPLLLSNVNIWFALISLVEYPQKTISRARRCAGSDQCLPFALTSSFHCSNVCIFFLSSQSVHLLTCAFSWLHLSPPLISQIYRRQQQQFSAQCAYAYLDVSMRRRKVRCSAIKSPSSSTPNQFQNLGEVLSTSAASAAREAKSRSVTKSPTGHTIMANDRSFLYLHLCEHILYRMPLPCYFPSPRATAVSLRHQSLHFRRSLTPPLPNLAHLAADSTRQTYKREHHNSFCRAVRHGSCNFIAQRTGSSVASKAALSNCRISLPNGTMSPHSDHRYINGMFAVL